jgi:Tfp pilus assembly protein PilF
MFYRTAEVQRPDYTLRELPVKRKTPESSKVKGTPGERQFYVEAEYADSIFRDALGDTEASIVALKRALEAMPTYAPAILSMGSVLYQTGKITEGRKLFQSLLSLPKTTTDIRLIIDEAGTFLTRFGAYEDGMALYRTAVKRYPDDSALFQGLGYCASNAGLHEEAVSANRRALELEPENQKLVNDLGWTLLQAGRLPQAREALERAVSMDPSDELAKENLRYCRRQVARRKLDEERNSQAARCPPRTFR